MCTGWQTMTCRHDTWRAQTIFTIIHAIFTVRFLPVLENGHFLLKIFTHIHAIFTLHNPWTFTHDPTHIHAYWITATLVFVTLYWFSTNVRSISLACIGVQWCTSVRSAEREHICIGLHWFSLHCIEFQQFSLNFIDLQWCSMMYKRPFCRTGTNLYWFALIPFTLCWFSINFRSISLTCIGVQWCSSARSAERDGIAWFNWRQIAFHCGFGYGCGIDFALPCSLYTLCIGCHTITCGCGWQIHVCVRCAQYVWTNTAHTTSPCVKDSLATNQPVQGRLNMMLQALNVPNVCPLHVSAHLQTEKDAMPSADGSDRFGGNPLLRSYDAIQVQAAKVHLHTWASVRILPDHSDLHAETSTITCSLSSTHALTLSPVTQNTEADRRTGTHTTIDHRPQLNT